MAELLFNTAPGLGNAHFIETVEQEHYPARFEQVKHNLRIEHSAQFGFEMFTDKAFERNGIWKLAQVDFDRNRTFRIIFAVAGQFVGKPLNQRAFTGTIITEHQPQSTTPSRNPLEGVR